MLIEFNGDTFTDKEKLQILLAHHNLIDKVKIEDDDDIPLLVMALNQDDVEKIKIDDEGALVIEYSGDNWQNNEQTTI